MFGREAERAQVELVLDAVAHGPAALVIEGAPGIGKTTLWRKAVESARQREYRVLEAAPSEPDEPLAFAGLGDVFERLPDRVLEGLSEPQRRAFEVALFLDRSSAAPSDLEALPRAILAALRWMSIESPVVVAIDDEQWLDRPSARVLGFAICRLRDERVGVLLSRRSESGGALWPELARGFGHATLSHESLTGSS